MLRPVLLILGILYTTECNAFITGAPGIPALGRIRTTRSAASLPASGLKCTATPVSPAQGSMTFKYSTVQYKTHPGISVWDVTPKIRQLVEEAGVKEGFVNVINQHTTTGITINEYESRLIDDIRQYLSKLAPASDPYLHNDLHLRPASEDDRQRVLKNGWDINDPKKLDEWRAQEPINAHSHLLGMLLGNSETIPVSNGTLCIGQWQSVMLVDLDGPRTRNVGIQVVGQK